jgi:diadenosine tetraphosphatase ApaH/serine/threonine PP2A family protein phosphatase
MWTREQLTEDHLQFLRELPHGPISPIDDVQLVHGSPRDEDEYILMTSDAYTILAQVSVPLTFFGHTHVQRCSLLDETGQGLTFHPSYKSRTSRQMVTLELEPQTKYLINPGSVGQPRDGDSRAAFLIYDTDDGVVTFYRVPYDIALAQEKIFAAGLPERLAFRLEEGR